jgi:hypothetical protein
MPHVPPLLAIRRFPISPSTANWNPWLLNMGLLSGILKSKLICTSLWCAPIHNPALTDLPERLPGNAGSSRTPCLDVLPRILTVLKSPEGSAANHCQIQGLLPPQRNEVPYMQVQECGGRTSPHPGTAKIRSKLRIFEKELCHETMKRQPTPRVARLHPGTHEESQTTRAAVVRWLGKSSTGPVGARL